MKRFLPQFCIITILSFSAGTLACRSSRNKAEVPKDGFNIVLITIDTLRADHLSCYGYERKTSPNIDKIAEKGILFKNVIAPSSWTAPSMVSLFTSVYPINHGIIHNLANTRNKNTYRQEVFSDKLTTLAEILKANGYTTFGIAAHRRLSEESGFARGFDYFKCASFIPARPVNNIIIHLWEKEIRKSDKFFLWVHYFDPHHPQHARYPWIEHYTSKALTEKLNLSEKKRGELFRLIPTFKKDPQTLSNFIALYDSEINFVDFYIGELIQEFELYKNTLIIITSDHGIGFLEHGYIAHGNTLYQEAIHIPLIIKLPDSSKKETVNKQVSLVDIMPSILQILNIDQPEQTVGKSFWKKKGLLSLVKKILLRKDIPGHNFAELDTNRILKTIMTPEWKYIYNYQDKTEQLYNIKSDPLELNNLVDKKTKQRNQLKKQLFNWISNSKKYPSKKQSIQFSPKEKEKLKTLGYIQ